MKVAFLTAGGLAPCLSASIGALVEAYLTHAPEVHFIGYQNGYRGLLLGNSIEFPAMSVGKAKLLYTFGGSPIGNSRVKLTNVTDCVRRGFIAENQNPLAVAANQLIKDKVRILHTIGGDDTNTMAAQLCDYLKAKHYNLTVIGLPKTVDNDVYPVAQSLGSLTAAEQGAIFFKNIANENTTSSRQLIIHEVMGRHCGWLTAYTARVYRERLEEKMFFPELNLTREKWDLDAVYIPEVELDFTAECERLTARMDEKDGVNIFLSEGAGTATIVREMEAAREKVQRDAFGHIALDSLNPGLWFAGKFADKLKADKVLVQKSGYFARSAAPNQQDLELIKRSANLAVKVALKGNSGVVGLDEDHRDELRLINFKRIRGGKPFDHQQKWYQELLNGIGQSL